MLPLQVKLLKCLVDNIVVDISFETLGGLCTVAFLESIDRHVQGQHLFKRSVILVMQPPMFSRTSSTDPSAQLEMLGLRQCTKPAPLIAGESMVLL